MKFLLIPFFLILFIEKNNGNFIENGLLSELQPIRVHLFNRVVNNSQNGDLRSCGEYRGYEEDKFGVYILELTNWTSHFWPQDHIYFQTSIKIYEHMVVFTQRYPRGIQECNTSRTKLRATFPSLNLTGSHYFSYHGLFLMYHQAGRIHQHTKISGGVEAGPLLLFKDNNSLIMTHYNEFMTQSIQYEGSIVNSGPMDSICPVPKNYESQTILVINESIIHAVNHWGKILRQKYLNKPRKYDYTTEYLGYSTDNGAYYYYRKEPKTKNMEETLEKVVDYAKSKEIPYKYWLLDSWWYFQDKETHGVVNWVAKPDIFPNGLKALYEKTKYFVQAHNRYWAPHPVYEKSYQFLHSNKTSLPIEYRFWFDFFQSNANWGLKVYEQDWLNLQFENLDQAYTNSTLMRTWLMEMGRAASDCGIVIQYCMPLGRHLLQSVEIPSVTQIRASNDYINEKQWNIGITSLLHYALELKPSKDSTWSQSIQPGNGYNRTEKYPEFQTLIMAMSTGPVTFADRIQYSNSTLILRTCRKDGVLLQPIQPLIPIHHWFYGQTIEPVFHGHIQESRMHIHGIPHSAIVLALELRETFQLFPHHLHEYEHQDSIVYSSSGNHLTVFNSNSPLELSPSITGTPQDYQLYFITPVLDDWIILGELNKFVPLSRARFVAIEINSQEVTLLLEGAVDELVQVDVACKIDKKWKRKQIQTQIPASGRKTVRISKASILHFSLHEELEDKLSIQ